MDLLLSKNPIFGDCVKAHAVSDHYVKLVRSATTFNIATGFISNESIVELERLVNFRKGTLSLNLLIGMNYLDKFTHLQYNALRRLSQSLNDNGTGNVFVSKEVYYHGKMYSFEENGKCTGAFVGSSNLGSFVNSSNSLIESDVFFDGTEASIVNTRIRDIISCIGTNFVDVPDITDFRKADFSLLDNHEHVKKVTQERVNDLERKKTGAVVTIPLKTEPKSNLNTYFGKGKIKDRYSPRNWYEVELILGTDLPHKDLLPPKKVPLTVVTDDGFQFQCERQGDNAKNFRSKDNLTILGKWIKGHMEAEGALSLGELVTEDTFTKFKKRNLVLAQTSESGVWLLKME